MARRCGAVSTLLLFTSLLLSGCTAEPQDDDAGRGGRHGSDKAPAELTHSSCNLQNAFVVPLDEIDLPPGYAHDGVLPQVVFEAFQCDDAADTSVAVLGVLVNPPDEVERNTSVQMGHVLVLDFFVEGTHPYGELGEQASFTWSHDATHTLVVESRGKAVKTITPEARPTDDWPGSFETRYLFVEPGKTRWMDVTHDPNGWGLGYPGSLHATGTTYETLNPIGFPSDQTRFITVNDVVFAFGEMKT